MEINDWEYQQLVAKVGSMHGEVWRLDITDKFRIKRENHEADIEIDNFNDFLTWVLENTPKPTEDLFNDMNNKQKKRTLQKAILKLPTDKLDYAISILEEKYEELEE